MEVKSSTIPGAGKGLFATKDYKKGETIGQYFGEFVKSVQACSTPKQDYLFTLENGKIICPSDDCLLSFANDAIDLTAVVEEVLAWLGPKKTWPGKTVLKTIKVVLDDQPMVHKDSSGRELDYNIDWDERGDELFVQTTQPVKKGQEFFIYYGGQYWRHPIYYMIKPRTK